MQSFNDLKSGNSGREKISLNDNWKFYPADIIDNDINSVADSRANQFTDVFLNGKHVGQHVGGYTAFVFEITDYLKYDGANLLVIKVDNSHNPDIPPLSADFNFYGGIYRDVWLIGTNPVHIDILNYGSPGIFISTPLVSDLSAQVKIRGRIINDTSDRKDIKVVNRIVDKLDNQVFYWESNLTIGSGASADFISEETISDPELWSPDSPYLYKVITTVYEHEKLVDEVVNPLGIRWFELKPGNGMFLNGKPIKLYGTNRHQDYSGLGNALTEDYHRKDIQIIKDNGFNFLRLAHYPQDPSLLKAADEAGIIIWEEIPIVNLITISESFYKNCKEMLSEMILQHYNHPSIFIWGYMNEVLLVKPDPMPDGYENAVVALASILNDVAKKEDPSRFTAAALSDGEIDNGSGFESIMDLIGMNLYFGWYYGEMKSVGGFLDSYHIKYPEKNIIISEYGAGSDERIHTNTPKAFDFSTEYQQLFHESTFKQIMERDYLVGSALWNQFDFGSNRRQDSKYGLNQKGIYFFNREPKDISRYYRAVLNNTPVIYIASREWNLRAGSEKNDYTQAIKVYSNLDEGELFINDSSLGRKSFDNFTAIWDVPFSNAANKLTARSFLDNQLIEDVVSIKFEDRSKLFLNENSDGMIALNAGAHYQYRDETGLIWEADKSYTKNWGYIEGRQIKTQHSIYNTADDALFQTAIENVKEYRFDLQNGRYEVQLIFCEIKYDKPGMREFDVFINDSNVIESLDLVNVNKKFYPVNKKFIISVMNSKGITIKFIPKKGESIINGISIKKIS
ncbi:MAG: glycoside hydrolase family 2 TIM barrel-domain containing protein [Ignavibacteriaceae bacterium]